VEDGLNADAQCALCLLSGTDSEPVVLSSDKNKRIQIYANNRFCYNIRY